ncbi:GlxA family transcriptional regulator [Craterilacuibacter sp.]|uniref:GlxA family transcriptional regulator n=1 Tax=Craterilacuibacter sp. TaxID=2870909 RepID=UPI003F3B453E
MSDVFFILTPNYLALDHAGPAEAMRIAADEGARLRLHTVGPEADCISSLGLASRVDPLPEKLPKHALLVLVGTVDEDRDYASPAAQQLVIWLQSTVRADTRIACICSGALLAAMAGLLNGRRCTTHHALTAKLAALVPSARVEQDRIFVEDGPIATSAGITAGIDLALWLIEQQAGAALAARVARRMVVYSRRDGAAPQLSPFMAHRNHLNPALHKAQDLIAADPAHPWSLAALAARVHVSPRHLSRLFREHAATSIVAYRQALQIEVARERIVQGARIEAAAEAAGFSSARTLRRVWKEITGGTPADARRQACR